MVRLPVLGGAFVLFVCVVTGLLCCCARRFLQRGGAARAASKRSMRRGTRPLPQEDTSDYDHAPAPHSAGEPSMSEVASQVRVMCMVPS